jgi:hypothetical protein
VIALAFAAGIAAGLLAFALAARARARRNQRDRLATAQHLALVRALSQP